MIHECDIPDHEYPVRTSARYALCMTGKQVQAKAFMRVAFVFCLILLILPCPVHSQDRGRLFLWEARSAGKTLFVLGSVHVLKPAAYPLDERIDRVYKKCRLIVFEADPDESSGPEMQKQLLSYGPLS